jgi:arginyl-tRNA synthetase
MPSPSPTVPGELRDPVRLLNERFVAAIRAAFPELPPDAADPAITTSRNPKFGDYQCNAAMGLAKVVGKPPREVAMALIAKVDLADLAEPLTPASIAGPGFINIALRGDVLAAVVASLDTPACGIPPGGVTGTVAVDLCGVNLAKQMHVGHLRSIIIGDCLARVLARLGGSVVRQNHVGDWGLPIAMVTDRLAKMTASGQDIARLDLDAIERVYRDAKRECDADEKGLAMVRKFNLGPKAEAELAAQVEGAREALASAKSTLVKLQSHDPATVAVWERIAKATMDECLAVCARLGADVRAEHSAGESSYAEELAGLVADLESRGVAEESDGALIVRLEGEADGGIAEPCLVRKSDGGFLYATTDLAGIRRRVHKLGASRLVYCVDARQGLHFKQVFAAARKAGYATVPAGRSGAGSVARLEHAAFGMVLGDDGKPFKTRSGDNVKLSALLDEAAERAGAAVREKNPDLPEPERRAVAEAVGIAAIKYADLSSDRAKDYVFNFDRMLAFEGNTGPYLLYALVRMRSIRRKAVEKFGTPPADAPLAIAAKEEKDLALVLVRYPGVVGQVAQTLEPHRLCQYLYELAGAFSVFFQNCPVLQAESDAARASRLRLCAVCERVMADGLNLLGIRALERM